MSIKKEDVLNNLEEVKKYILEAEQKKEEKVIGIALKNRWTGDIIFRSTKTVLKDAVEEAVKSGVDLSWVNLGGADLSGVDLSGANLNGADLHGCLYYMGIANRNFEALCKAIKTIRHGDGKFEDLVKRFS